MRIRYAIKDMIYLTVIVAVCLAWFVHAQRQEKTIDDLSQWRQGNEVWRVTWLKAEKESSENRILFESLVDAVKKSDLDEPKRREIFDTFLKDIQQKGIAITSEH